MARYQKQRIRVIDLSKSNKTITEIDRTPRQHSGWQSVTYQGNRYQLFGGIRNQEFIDLCHTIKVRQEAK